MSTAVPCRSSVTSPLINPKLPKFPELRHFCGQFPTESLILGYDTLLIDQEYIDAAITRSTSDTAVVRKRFERARQVMLLIAVAQ